MATFGGNLRKYRTDRGLSLEKLAAKLGHKRPSTVQSWEANRRRPRPAAVQQLAEALEISPAQLLKDVPSDYDALKGTVPSAEDVRPARLTPLQAAALDVAAAWAKIEDAHLREMLKELVEFHAAPYTRDASRPADATPSSNVHPATRASSPATHRRSGR